MGVWTRRRFLKTGTGLLAAGAAPGLWSCADEGLNPENYLVLWVAQSVTGSVITADGAPVSGAEVLFQMTIDPGFYVTASPGGAGLTTNTGSYKLTAAVNGSPDNYWLLKVDAEGRYTVHVRFFARKAGVGSGQIDGEFTRVASREPPRGNTAGYQLSQTIALVLPG